MTSKSVTRAYASIGELAKAAKSRMAMDGMSQNAQHRPDKDWDYGAGFDGALKLVGTGWIDGAKRIRALADRLVEKVAGELAPTALEYRDDGGPMIDVARYLEGEPEHFIEFAPEPARKPVTLVINIACAFFVTPEQVENRGAAVLAAAEILQARGYVVTIEGLSNVRGARTRAHRMDDHTTTFTIHRAGDVIDGDAIAFAMAHPAMNRRLIFAIREGERDAYTWGFHGYRGRGRTKKAGGYGHPCEPMALPSGIYQGALVTDTDFATDAATEARVLEICKQAGCELVGN